MTISRCTVRSRFRLRRRYCCPRVCERCGIADASSQRRLLRHRLQIAGNERVGSDRGAAAPTDRGAGDPHHHASQRERMRTRDCDRHGSDRNLCWATRCFARSGRPWRCSYLSRVRAARAEQDRATCLGTYRAPVLELKIFSSIRDRPRSMRCRIAPISVRCVQNWLVFARLATPVFVIMERI